MTATYNFALHVFQTLPSWLAAVLVGWAISTGITQSVKFTMPLKVDPDIREMIARVLAFLSAAIPAGMYYADQPGANPAALVLVMTGAGLWSPIAYAILQAVLRRYLPWVAEALSGDSRGVLAAKLRGDP